MSFIHLLLCLSILLLSLGLSITTTNVLAPALLPRSQLHVQRKAKLFVVNQGLALLDEYLPHLIASKVTFSRQVLSSVAEIVSGTASFTIPMNKP